MTTQEKELTRQDQQGVSQEAQRMERRALHAPATDVYEREDAYVLAMDVPGVSEKDVDLQLEDDVLTIHARAGTHEVEDYELLYGEYRASDYERSFTLSSDIDRERIKATVKSGVLRVVLPKVEKMKPRKIEVQAE